MHLRENGWQLCKVGISEGLSCVGGAFSLGAPHRLVTLRQVNSLQLDIALAVRVKAKVAVC